MIAAPPVLEMGAVTRSFATAAGRVDVLRGVDLRIAPGDFIAITGPSGSGKSTLLNLAALLDQPSTGDVRLDGEDIARADANRIADLRKHKIGMVFQQFHLLTHRSVLDNVAFRYRYTRTSREDARHAARQALETVGLAGLADRTVRVLSGGEMQRVAIARAIALRPVLLVADEPTGNLDAGNSRNVMDYFRRLNNEGLTILMVTHNDHLLSYCSRHLVCHEGRIAEADRP